MDADLRREWLAALRSGKYRQGEGSLRVCSNSRPSYCCLGVLCRTMGARWIDGFPKINKIVLEHEEDSYLSAAALKITGLDRATQETLATMNDSGTPFKEIADYIECNVPAEHSPSPQETASE